MHSKVFILDFDNTICKLVVDWKALKNELKTKFFNYYDFYDLRLFEIYDLLLNNENLSDDVIKIIQKFEQKNNSIKYKEPNIELINFFETFYVISNNLTSTVEKFLVDQKALNRCRGIIGVDIAKSPKPNVRAFEILLNRYPEIKRDNCIYIGDSDIDEEFAKRSKIQFFNIKNLDYGKF
ncbi:MAG: HAD hydrolase-like protein [Hydrotalea sp.]|nr:HAD hydrolase-like protein [Hydrotalea sp.]